MSAICFNLDQSKILLSGNAMGWHNYTYEFIWFRLKVFSTDGLMTDIIT